jgi:hypothetical protein
MLLLELSSFLFGFFCEECIPRGYEIEARLCFEDKTELSKSILVREYMKYYNFPIILAARSQKIG